MPAMSRTTASAPPPSHHRTLRVRRPRVFDRSLTFHIVRRQVFRTNCSLFDRTRHKARNVSSLTVLLVESVRLDVRDTGAPHRCVDTRTVRTVIDRSHAARSRTCSQARSVHHVEHTFDDVETEGLCVLFSGQARRVSLGRGVSRRSEVSRSPHGHEQTYQSQIGCPPAAKVEPVRTHPFKLTLRNRRRLHHGLV